MMAGKYVYVKAPKRNDISQADSRGWWSEKKKNEALAFYVANGSLAETSRECQVPLPTLNKWKASDWWKDRIRDIQNEEYDKLDVKLSKALEKALDQVMDRIEHGDHIYDPRTGQIRQIPAKLRDVNHAFNSIMDKRQLIRKQPTKIVEQQNTAVQLANLAEQFAAFVSGKKVTEKVDELAIEFIEGETVEQDEDGTYRVIDTGVDDGLEEGETKSAWESSIQPTNS
jgi:DNA polymerase III alpha subunit (gram-positive type)